MTMLSVHITCILLLAAGCRPEPKQVTVQSSIPDSTLNSRTVAKGIEFDLKHVNSKDTLSLYAAMSIPVPVSVNMLKVHQLIWNLKDVRSSALDLRHKHVDAFTMTDQSPGKDGDCYIIGFYQFLQVHMPRMDTYRVWLKTKKIEKLNMASDKWERIKHI